MLAVWRAPQGCCHDDLKLASRATLSHQLAPAPFQPHCAPRPATPPCRAVQDQGALQHTGNMTREEMEAKRAEFRVSIGGAVAAAH